jgi:hypothetical protein
MLIYIITDTSSTWESTQLVNVAGQRSWSTRPLNAAGQCGWSTRRSTQLVNIEVNVAGQRHNVGGFRHGGSGHGWELMRLGES